MARRTLKALVLTAAALLTPLSGAATATAAEVTLRVHHFLPATSTTHADFLEPWAERVETQSDGRIAVEIFPAMQLGGRPPQLVDQVRDGVVDAAWTLPGYTPGRFPRTEVFELPFMPASAEATSQALMAFHQRHLVDEYADQNLHPILLHAHAPGVFHMRGEPVTDLAALAGRKVRAPSRVIKKALDALDAAPVGMPVPQVPQALSRGVIDGTLIPWEVARPLKVHELVESHTEVRDERGFYTATFAFVMNKETYDGLPADLRAVIDANSGLELAEEIGRVWDEADAAGMAAAKAEGNRVIRLTPSEVARWRTRTAPVIEEWITAREAEGIDGAALVRDARAMVERFDDAGDE